VEEGRTGHVQRRWFVGSRGIVRLLMDLFVHGRRRSTYAGRSWDMGVQKARGVVVARK
jgi:hypothetical protein